MSTRPTLSHNAVWTKRFVTAAIIQGAIVCGLTMFIVLGQISIIKPEVSRVMAGGGAGTWFTFGFVIYVLVGIIGVAVSGLFYHFLEFMLRQHLEGIAKMLAWIHIVLMNVGTTVAAGLLMYAGYIGGASMLPESVGGRGLDAAGAHNIMAPFVEPISAAIIAILISIMAGGIGYLLAYRSATKSHSLELGSEVDIT